jgi:hypothetical protein
MVRLRCGRWRNPDVEDAGRALDAVDEHRRQRPAGRETHPGADVNEFVDQFVVGKNKVCPPSTLRNGTRRAKSAWRGKELSSNCAARLSISQ